MLRLLFLFLFLLLNLTSSAQVSSKAKKLYLDSFDKMLFKEYDEAEEMLLKAVKMEPKYTQAYLQLAKLYEQTENYDKVREAYERILEIEPRFQYKALIKLGDLAQFTEDLETATQHYEAALADPAITENPRAYVERQLANCRFIVKAMANPVPFDPIDLGPAINSSFDEYLPSLTADEQTLVFTRRFDSVIAPNEDFYISEKDENGEWQMAEDIGKDINTPHQEGSIAITPDGQKRFFAAKDRWNTIGSFDLYYSYKLDGVWVLPRNIDEPINTTAWESQPSISADGRTLYYSSNASGGIGGRDIYRVHRLERGWSAPELLTDKINTAGDEQCPFIHPDGKTLYFSSDGHVGMGDTDIYMSQLDENGQWSEPKNLGYPINNKFNQSGFTVSANGERAYFTSETEENGLDIFYFELPPEIRPANVTYVKGRVIDAESEQAVQAVIEIIDLESGETINKVVSDIFDGKFLVTLAAGKDYLYNVSRDGYLFYSESYPLKEMQKGEPYKLEVRLQPIKVGETVVLKNIFFETGAYELKSISEPELQKLIDLMTENPAIRIEISGHTDNVGSADSNLVLSGNRAKAVANYLIGKGITQDRISHKGLGDQQPVASNDTEEGRAQNRRTEFKVIK